MMAPEATCYSSSYSLSFEPNLPHLGQISGTFLKLTFAQASNQNRSFHDVTTGNIAATKTIINIKEK